MNKHFVFKDNSWWNNPPCDCCRSEFVGGYTCLSHEEIEYGCCSILDCLYCAYHVVTGKHLYDTYRYPPTQEDIEQMLKELGITLEFIE